MSVAIHPGFSGSLSRTDTLIDAVSCISDSFIALERVMTESVQSIAIVSDDNEGDIKRNNCLLELSMVHESAEKAMKDLKYLIETSEMNMLQALGEDQGTELANGSIVERYSDRKEKWIESKVVLAVANIVKQHAFDPESGAVVLDPDHAARLVELVLALMGKTKPKKQALKAHNVDINSLCTWEWGPEKIRIIPLDAQTAVSHPDDTMVVGG